MAINNSSIDTGTPEGIFGQASVPAVQSVPTDAIHCAVSRSEAILHLLMAHFDSDERCSDEIISNAIWSVIGNLEQVHRLLRLGQGRLLAAA